MWGATDWTSDNKQGEFGKNGAGHGDRPVRMHAAPARREARACERDKLEQGMDARPWEKTDEHEQTSTSTQGANARESAALHAAREAAANERNGRRETQQGERAACVHDSQAGDTAFGRSAWIAARQEDARGKKRDPNLYMGRARVMFCAQTRSADVRRNVHQIDLVRVDARVIVHRGKRMGMPRTM